MSRHLLIGFGGGFCFALLLFLLLALAVDLSTVHDAPSLENTVAWIKVRMPEFCSVKYKLPEDSTIDHKASISSIEEVDKCVIRITEVRDGLFNLPDLPNVQTTIRTCSIALRSIDLMGIRVEPDQGRLVVGSPAASFVLPANGAATAILCSEQANLQDGDMKQVESNLPKEEVKYNTLSLYTAARLAAAFRNASRLCGAKAELF